MEDELLLESGKMGQPWAALSGGERQRAAIACALLLASTVCHTPSAAAAAHFISGDSLEGGVDHAQRQQSVCDAVLLLDEPTAACDAVSCAAVEQTIAVSGAAVILVTHDEQQAARFAHRRVVLTTS